VTAGASNCQFVVDQDLLGGGILAGLVGGRFIGAFDKFAVLELRVGP
jgi:hypothetical protein